MTVIVTELSGARGFLYIEDCLARALLMNPFPPLSVPEDRSKSCYNHCRQDVFKAGIEHTAVFLESISAYYGGSPWRRNRDRLGTSMSGTRTVGVTGLRNQENSRRSREQLVAGLRGEYLSRGRTTVPLESALRDHLGERGGRQADGPGRLARLRRRLGRGSRYTMGAVVGLTASAKVYWSKGANSAIECTAANASVHAELRLTEAGFLSVQRRVRRSGNALSASPIVPTFHLFCETDSEF
ncbi:hypothetical protein F5141DRAFT_1202467 [Pisolithus sp. B1]|nr:hypothetical protein F5141DRAFT_1202467 [Pisolithus sp. B1]